MLFFFQLTYLKVVEKNKLKHSQPGEEGEGSNSVIHRRQNRLSQHWNSHKNHFMRLGWIFFNYIISVASNFGLFLILKLRVRETPFLTSYDPFGCFVAVFSLETPFEKNEMNFCLKLWCTLCFRHGKLDCLSKIGLSKSYLCFGLRNLNGVR